MRVIGSERSEIEKRIPLLFRCVSHPTGLLGTKPAQWNGLTFPYPQFQQACHDGRSMVGEDVHRPLWKPCTGLGILANGDSIQCSLLHLV